MSDPVLWHPFIHSRPGKKERRSPRWIQPPRIEHVVLDYSDDYEVLEVILPADFKTVELE